MTDNLNAANIDPSHRELSIEELEAIAAGGWFNWIVHEVKAIVHFFDHPHPYPTPRGPQLPPGRL